MGQAEWETKDARLLRVLADGHSRDMWAVHALLPERWSISEIEQVLDRLVQRRYLIDDRPGEVSRGATTMYVISGEGMAAVRRAEQRPTVTPDEKSGTGSRSSEDRRAATGPTADAGDPTPPGIAGARPRTGHRVPAGAQADAALARSPAPEVRSAAPSRHVRLSAATAPLLAVGGAALLVAAVAWALRTHSRPLGATAWS